MSVYVYLECLDHDPPLRSHDEISQHWDGHVDAAIRMAQGIDPVPADLWAVGDNFRRNAALFLTAHPRCAVGTVDEYGQRTPIPGRGPDHSRAAAERVLLRARERHRLAVREIEAAHTQITAAEAAYEALDDVEEASVTVVDRLTRGDAPLSGHDPAAVIDEIVLTDAAVHVERLDRATWMVILENARAHFHLTVTVSAVVEYEMRADGRQLGTTDTWSADVVPVHVAGEAS